MLFDVPVIGPQTVDVMIETKTSALAIDAGRTLMLDREDLIGKANAAGIAIIGMEPVATEQRGQAEAPVPHRIAVIGAGAFGRNHVRVVAENPRAELKYVVDSNLARAREHAEPRGADRRRLPRRDRQSGCGNHRRPTIAHAEAGCALLEAGIDVLIEKPIAPTLAEADRLIEAAER
jgi:hypothetical protein